MNILKKVRFTALLVGATIVGASSINYAECLGDVQNSSDQMGAISCDEGTVTPYRTVELNYGDGTRQYIYDDPSGASQQTWVTFSPSGSMTCTTVKYNPDGSQTNEDHPAFRPESI